MSKANEPEETAPERGTMPTPWQRGETTSNTGLTAGDVAKAAQQLTGDATVGPPAPGVPGDGSSGAPTRAVPVQSGPGVKGPSGQTPPAPPAPPVKAPPTQAVPVPGGGAGGPGGGKPAPGTAGAAAAAVKSPPGPAQGPGGPGPRPGGPGQPGAPGPHGPGPGGPKGGSGLGKLVTGTAVTGPGPRPGVADPDLSAERSRDHSAPTAATTKTPVAPPAGPKPDLDAIHKTGAKADGDRAAVRRIPASSTIGTPLRAAVQVRRVDPWSIFKVSGVLAIAGFLIWMIAIAVLYGVLAGMGVWDQINSSFGTLVSADGSSSGGDLISTGQVFGFSALFGVFAAIVLTALATILAYIYNVCADVVGGVEVTLADLD